MHHKALQCHVTFLKERLKSEKRQRGAATRTLTHIDEVWGEIETCVERFVRRGPLKQHNEGKGEGMQLRADMLLSIYKFATRLSFFHS